MPLLLLIIIFIIILGFLLAYSIVSYRANTKLKTQLTLAESTLKQTNTELLHTQQVISELNIKSTQEMYDPITKVLGWRLFEDRLNQNIKESARYQLTLGVLFIDIDEFKVINDALGYEVGNQLLREVAKRLQECIRQVDSISRFAKDTFSVLLIQLMKPETAAVVVQRMLQSLSAPFQIRGHELYITACIGVAIYPSDGQNAESLLRSADEALHLAKAKGKHSYQFYQANMHLKSQRELSLYTSLSRESIFQEFVFYYQPIINIRDDTVACMDMMLHWQHPDYGLIMPNEIMNLAERQRKLNAITEWMLQKACQQFQHWHSFGFEPELLGIPLSMTQLESTQFIYQISRVLQASQFNPAHILFEVKERIIEAKFDLLEKAFNMLQYMGVKIAIDDFGYGLFSLKHLKHFHIDYLKLDTALVDDIHHHAQSAALVKSIVFLADNMSMQVIIRGVETEEQLLLLKEQGCSLMQGSFLHVPVREDEVEAKMISTQGVS